VSRTKRGGTSLNKRIAKTLRQLERPTTIITGAVDLIDAPYFNAL
jgi:hypothetical protein